MVVGFVLLLREGLEAALIVGMVLGALRKLGRAHLARVVWAGTASAAILSLIAGLLLNLLGASLEGQSEEIFEGLTMLAAAGVLTWMIFWMRRQSSHARQRVEADVSQASGQGSRLPLFLVAFLAVLREGIEISLFLTAAILVSGRAATLLGATLGLGAALIIAWGLFRSLLRLDLGKFFLATCALLALFAAGLVAHGVHELNEVGWIPALVEHVWDLNPVLDEQSAIGQALAVLFGYNGNPSLTEVLAYISYLASVTAGLLIRRPPVPSPKAAQ